MLITVIMDLSPDFLSSTIVSRGKKLIKELINFGCLDKNTLK